MGSPPHHAPAAATSVEPRGTGPAIVSGKQAGMLLGDSGLGLSRQMLLPTSAAP